MTESAGKRLKGAENAVAHRARGGVDAALDRALDQDDADAEEGRCFKQVHVIDEICVECREDKDQPNDPFE